MVVEMAISSNASAAVKKNGPPVDEFDRESGERGGDVSIN